MPDVTNATATTGVGQQTGTESSLSNWAGPYVTEMLGKGQALAEQPYQAYTGPLTAGPSETQQTAFQGIAGLTIPTDQMKAFTPQQFSAEDAQRLMNPYLTAALNPQIEEAKRQAQIQNLQNRTAATKAGAFGGGRGAQHVGLYGFDIFHSLAHDDCLRIALLEPFRHHAVLGSVEEPLFPISKCVVRNIAELVLVPDVIASALLARCPVAVRLLIHLLNFLTFL